MMNTGTLRALGAGPGTDYYTINTHLARSDVSSELSECPDPAQISSADSQMFSSQLQALRDLESCYTKAFRR